MLNVEVVFTSTFNIHYSTFDIFSSAQTYSKMFFGS